MKMKFDILAEYGKTITVIWERNHDLAQKVYDQVAPLFDEAELVNINEYEYARSHVVLCVSTNTMIEDEGLCWQTFFLYQVSNLTDWTQACSAYLLKETGDYVRISEEPEAEMVEGEAEEDCRRTLGEMLSRHFGTVFISEYRKLKNAKWFKAQPAYPWHISFVDVRNAVEYLKDCDKVIFWGFDERLHEYTTLRCQCIADMIDAEVLYFTEDLIANEIYEQLFENRYRKNPVHMVGGLGAGFHALQAHAKLNKKIANTDFSQPRSKKFLMYSFKPRSIRISTLGFLFEKGLDKQGLISFMGLDNAEALLDWLHQPTDVPAEDEKYLEKNKDYLINVMEREHSYPMLLDYDFSGNDINESDGQLAEEPGLDNHDQTYFSIAQETMFYKDILNTDYAINATESTHAGGISVTEKVYKPMVCKHPFVLAGSAHTLRELKKYGFKTFSPWFDETYDSIEHDGERMEALFAEIERLCAIPDAEWQKMQQEMLPVLEHNLDLIISDGKDLMFDPTHNNIIREFVDGL